jgi:DUF1680 family protein
METCVGTSWMQLCAHLLRITGDSRFADEIEKTAYNALAGAMTADGSSFAQYSSLAGVRTLGELQCGMELNCCVANGPRGLMLLPEVAVMQGAEGPVVSLYADGAWKFRLPSGAPARLTMKTDYPKSGEVEMRMTAPAAERFALRLRIPQWSETASATVNGAPVGGVRPGAWALIARRWGTDDTVHLRLDMHARVVRLSDGNRQFAAVVRGPVALARDLRLAPGSVDEPVTLKPDQHGNLPLQAVTPPPGIESAFETSAGVALCDYASAGNTWDQRSRFRTWMPT